MDWNTFYRDLKEQPFITPLLEIYYKFMGIRRYEHMPFYLYPAAKQWISYEDTILTFFDWLIDAHEDARNDGDKNRSFYSRSIYFMENYLRW